MKSRVREVKGQALCKTAVMDVFKEQLWSLQHSVERSLGVVNHLHGIGDELQQSSEPLVLLTDLSRRLASKISDPYIALIMPSSHTLSPQLSGLFPVYNSSQHYVQLQVAVPCKTKA